LVQWKPTMIYSTVRGFYYSRRRAVAAMREMMEINEILLAYSNSNVERMEFQIVVMELPKPEAKN